MCEPAFGHRELVGVALARLDRRLGDERHAVLVVRQLEAVEVDRGGLGELVLER